MSTLAPPPPLGPHRCLHHRRVHTVTAALVYAIRPTPHRSSSSTIDSTSSSPHRCMPLGPHHTAPPPPPSGPCSHHHTGVCHQVHTTLLLLLCHWIHAGVAAPVYTVRSTSHCASSSAVGSTLVPLQFGKPSPSLCPSPCVNSILLYFDVCRSLYDCA
jgi:hypothetical protein